MKPAPPNSGVVFCRTDLNGVCIKADMANIDFEALQLATTLRNGDAIVQTTEHLMSALYSMGVDNIVIELDAAEVPIMDGSAMPFILLIEEAGIKQQAVARKVLKITRPFSYEKDDKHIRVEPASNYSITYEIDFDHPLIRRQSKTLTIDARSFDDQIAPARTFGFLRDVNYLKSIGLIKGGSLENAIVLDGDRILNGSLRLDDEFVSHKILDMIGDFAVVGTRIQGHFYAEKAGHEVHALFMRALLENEDCYEIVAQESQESTSIFSPRALATA